MRNRFPAKVIYLSALLIASLLLSGQALACIFPSIQEMREDRSVACCAERCRFGMNDQAAQKACDQSRQAPSQHEVLLSSSVAPALEMVKLLPDPGSVLPIDLAFHDPVHSTQHVNEPGLSKRFVSVKIYTLIHSLLI